MVWIGNHFGPVVQKDGLCLVKAYTVLFDIGFRLCLVPLEV